MNAKVSIGRASNGWNTTGFIALIGQVIVCASTLAELVEKLDEAGVSRDSWMPAGPEEGDRALSPASRRELLELQNTNHGPSTPAMS
jgi:hypothetical protein